MLCLHCPPCLVVNYFKEGRVCCLGFPESCLPLDFPFPAEPEVVFVKIPLKSSAHLVSKTCFT